MKYILHFTALATLHALYIKVFPKQIKMMESKKLNIWLMRTVHCRKVFREKDLLCFNFLTNILA